jgi:hypothetical protein
MNPTDVQDRALQDIDIDMPPESREMARPVQQAPPSSQPAPTTARVVRELRPPEQRSWFEHSEEINEIAAALAAAQGKFGEVVASETAQVESRRTNVKYSYEYETLAAVLDAVRAPLSENGIALLQPPTTRERGVIVLTMLVHTSGQWFRSYLTMPCDSGDPQAVGSAITYARRYALKSILGLAPDSADEDDAQAARASRQDAPRPAQRASQAARQEPARQDQPHDPTTGKIIGLKEKSGGLMAKLDTGFVFATRNPELAQAVRDHHQRGSRVKLECQASDDPSKYAPTLLELALADGGGGGA